jgi:hypothetical protein
MSWSRARFVVGLEDGVNDYPINVDGRHDVANPVTDVNVYLMTSSDGRSWHGPVAVSKAASDQWFPWVDVKVNTQPSHPRNSIFFQAGVEGCCQKCDTFIGDYNGLDYGRDGKVNMAWTDMRRFTTVEDASGYAQNIFFARR